MDAMTEIRPQAGKQEQFLSTSADIAIYGGGAGSGKTWALLLEPLRHIKNSKFGAVVFRRSYPQITNQGGLWDKSLEVYPLVGGKPKTDDKIWIFPSGAKLKFSHLQYDTSVIEWQGSEVPLFLWDELTHFSRAQFIYMLSRSRSTSGIRPYVRGTCNPEADSWVSELLEWWIDQDTGYAIPERSGVIRWFYVVDDVLRWYATRELAEAAHPAHAKIAPPKSFTFVVASIYDNPILLEKDPGYLGNLMALSLVDRERLLGGNWKVRSEAGKVFNRDWFEIVTSAADGGFECRGLDFAATEKKLSGNDPDFTAAVKIRKVGATFYIIDCIAVQKAPADVDALVTQIIESDHQKARESRATYLVRWEIEPGSAGKRESYRLSTSLSNHDARGVISTGDKLSRVKAFAVQASIGNVKIVRGAWNEELLTHIHHQPDS